MASLNRSSGCSVRAPARSCRSGPARWTIVAFARCLVLAVADRAVVSASSLVSLVSPAAGRWTHRVIVGGLVALFASLQLLRGSIGRVPAALIAIPLAVGATVLVVRSQEAATVPALSGVRSPAVPGALLRALTGRLGGVRWGPRNGRAARGRGIGAAGPIVMIVLDELPLTLVARRRWRCRPGRVPGAAAARRGRDLSHETTPRSRPPPSLRCPGDPDRTHAGDRRTAADRGSAPEKPLHAARRRLRAACRRARDPGVPAASCARPRRAEAARSIRQRTDLAAAGGPGSVHIQQASGSTSASRTSSPGGRLDWLVDGLETGSDESHGCTTCTALLPHQDWERLPEGQTYEAAPTLRCRDHNTSVTEDVALRQVAEQRHLLQVAYADALVGEVLDELRATDRYDGRRSSSSRRTTESPSDPTSTSDR